MFTNYHLEETPSTELIGKESSVDVTVSQDSAWSKRGKAMNSLSGEDVILYMCNTCVYKMHASL